MTERRVVLVCGPPGAGKTTLARELAAEYGLAVYDRDHRAEQEAERHLQRAQAEVRLRGERAAA